MNLLLPAHSNLQKFRLHCITRKKSLIYLTLNDIRKQLPHLYQQEVMHREFSLVDFYLASDESKL